MPGTTTRRSFLKLAALAAAGVGTAGCSLLPGGSASSAAAGPAELAQPIDGSRTLVAYLSVPETDDPGGMTEDEANSTHVVDGRVLGNVQHLAQLIAARTGGQLFRIDTAEPLPRDHDALEELALGWQEQGTRPELKELASLDAVDTVFIGYPIWWYDLPMPLYSFLEQHDLSGKTVVLFSVHGGSNLSGTDQTIAELLTDSTIVSDPFTISRGDMDRSDEQLSAWLDGVGVA